MASKTRKIILPEVIPNTMRLYLDGSAIHYKANPDQIGGWGVYQTDGKAFSKGFKCGARDTTVSRMEMSAMDYALGLTIKHFEEGNTMPMKIYSDSQMVVRSILLGWLKNWVRERFVNRLNADIWRKIWDKLEKLRSMRVDYTIEHMNGHLEDLEHPHIFGNHMADGFADYKQYINKF